MPAHYPFTAHDEQSQITDLFCCTSAGLMLSLHAEKCFFFLPSAVYHDGSEAPLLALVRLKEVDGIMETPSHRVVVYFHVGANANGGGAAKARYACKNIVSADRYQRCGLENSPNNS